MACCRKITDYLQNELAFRDEITVSNTEPVLPENSIRNCQLSLIIIVDRPAIPIVHKYRKSNLMIRIMIIIEKIKKNVRKVNIGQSNLIINAECTLKAK